MLHYQSTPELTSTYLDSTWSTLPLSVRPATFLSSTFFSEHFDCQLTIVSETFQHTGSFKFRAAYNLLRSIPQQHIVTASSGNFGQAVAYASKLLGKSCIVVMPQTSAQVKIAAVKSYGGTVELIDVHHISRAERVQQLLTEQPGSFRAQAYDDYRVIAGNSTLGMEIFRHTEFDIVIAPVGGGGLSSGIVLARDHMHTATKIIGAEPVPGNDASLSFQSGKLISNEQEPATIADGARTVSLGQINWEILRSGLTDIIEVPDELTTQALRDYFLYANLKVEPTGALALAALFAQPQRFKGKRICCVVSGGNVDPETYAHLLTGSL